MNISYGVSAHYLGSKGKQYFAWQSRGGAQMGRIEARKFSQYIKSTDCVLDFGCGNGSLLMNLTCNRRIGVEVNPAAREVCGLAGVEVFRSLAEMPLADIDVIISNHALEHVPHPLIALQEMRDKLRPKGRLILCLPFDDWRTQRRYKPSDSNRHFYTWSPLLIGNLLEEAGFGVEETWIYAHAWPRQWQWLDEHLPVAVFDLICTYYAWKKNRRQVFALASKAQE